MDSPHAPSNAMVDAGAFGALLLRIYELARTHTVHAFQQEVMVLLSDLLAYDGGWWGRSNVDASHLHVNCSYLYNLPEDTPDRLNSSDPGNVFAALSTAAPDQTHQFFASDFRDHASTAALNDYLGCAQMICITRVEQPSRLASFIALMRHKATPAFEMRDRDLLEILMPHLATALDLCCMTQMTRLRRGSGEAMLTTDADGWVYVSEPAVRPLLCLEWPDWSGRRLPPALIECIANKQPLFLGRRIRADVARFDTHVLVTLRPREPRDALTRQECAVAERFSSGLSYKEVAQKLQLAPATIRHYLRSVYLKLGVSDKAALAQALGSPPAGPPPGGLHDRTGSI